MKKLFIVIYALFVGIANADNVITSKEYVDAAGATLQPQISAKNTNTVLTYPAAGTDAPGEKAIYDTTAAFDAQTDALVTAGAFNSAVQNALESEFVCIEWQGSIHDNAHCLLYQIRAPYNQSPNLLCTPAAIVHGAFDPTTGIFTNTDAETKNYTNINIQLYQGAAYGTYIGQVLGKDIPKPQTIKTTFTTSENTHYLHIKHNDTSFDVSVFFPIEPSTTYTVLVNAIEINPSVVGGMKLQLMLVQGEYDSDEFIPCGNVYIPQSQ